MTPFLILILIISVGTLVFWIYQLILGFSGDRLHKEVEDVLDSRHVELTLIGLDHGLGQHLTRGQIFEKMSRTWKETRICALGCGSFLASLFLFLSAVFYMAVFFKTLMRPNADDLRLLLGWELFMVCQIRRRYQ